MHTHYLDHAATTKPSDAAITAMLRCMTEHYGNPSSLHSAGLRAKEELDLARHTIADALGCTEREILFTSCATESTNTAFRSIAAAYGRKRKKIVTTAVEHASVRQTLAWLRDTQGFEIVEVLPNPADHQYHAADILAAIDDQTCLVTMMLVNNETGHILPVETVFRTAKRRFPELITHCDAVQGFLKLRIRVNSLGADYLSVSGHKVHAAKGIGALYVRKGCKLHPMLHGGKQENGFRAGTESVPLIAGFGAAVAALAPNIEQNYETVRLLNTVLREKLSALDGVRILSPENASPYILSVIVPHIRSEILLHYLEHDGIYISSGSACAKGAISSVPSIFGASEQERDHVLRISFCEDNTMDDVDALVRSIAAGQNEIMHN